MKVEKKDKIEAVEMVEETKKDAMVTGAELSDEDLDDAVGGAIFMKLLSDYDIRK